VERLARAASMPDVQQALLSQQMMRELHSGSASAKV